MDIYTIFLLQYSLFWCEILDIYRLYILLNGQLSHTIFVNMPGMRVVHVQTPRSYTGPRFTNLGTWGVTSQAETTIIKSWALFRRLTVGST